MTEAGEVDWTQAQIDSFNAKKTALITLLDADGKSLGAIGGMTTADQLGDSNAAAFLSLIDQ